MLPYADSFLVEIAQSAVDNACFVQDIVDQYLTMLSLEGGEYDGESDFGTLTRIDLDDEHRTLLVILELVAIGEGFGERNVENLISHYRKAHAMIGEGNDQKWWSDFWTADEEEADLAQSTFAANYSAWLGDEDDEEEDTEGDPRNHLHPNPTLADEFRQAERIIGTE